MPKLPPVTPKKFIRIIERLGFVKFRSKGSHFIFVHPDGRKVVVAVHGRDLPKGTLSGMLKDIQVSVEDFVSLL